MSFKSPDTRVSPSAALTLPLLRPMEIGELLDEAFDLYKRNFRLFISIAVLWAVPMSAVQLATPETSGWLPAVLILSSLVSMVTNGALVYAALERHLGRQTTVAAAYRVGARRFLRLFSANLVYGLALLGGFVALIVPAFIAALWGFLLIPVVVTENCGGISAFQRARRLCAGNLWRVFFVVLGLALITVVFWVVLVALAELPQALLGAGPSGALDRSNPIAVVLQAVSTVISNLFGAAWYPLFAAAPLLTYLDLRIRREAYDLELLTNAVEERVAAARAPVATPGQTGP
jgi:hypothetical protein